MAPARLLLLLAAFAALFGSALAVAPKCPAGCFCSGSGSGSGSSGGGSKVECYPMANGGVDFASLPPDTVHLDLAKYGLKELTAGMFAATPRLEKLDLQNNGIEHVEEGAFDGLRSLQVLDMSRNGLEFVNSDMFSGLVSLQRLKITGNRIQTVESGAFDDLRALQKLDISENPFVYVNHITGEQRQSPMNVYILFQVRLQFGMVSPLAGDKERHSWDGVEDQVLAADALRGCPAA